MYYIVKNDVEEYLKANMDKKISLRKIYRDLKMKRRKTIWLIHQSKNIRLVDPLEVGCNKKFVHVYSYQEPN